MTLSRRSLLNRGAIFLLIAGLVLLAAEPVAARGTRQLLKKKPDSSGGSSNLREASQYAYHGEGTEYSDDIPKDGAKDFTCSFPTITPWMQKYFVALNVKQWDEGRNCGRCVKVTCVDPKCKGQPDVIAFIVDQCPICAYGDLDFGMTPWSDLAGISPDRVQIAWNFTSCHDYIDENIVFHPKDDIDQYWQAFIFSNARYRPVTVTLNGEKLKMSENNFWVHDGETPDAPYIFELTSYGGSTVKFEVDDLFTSQDTGVQFGGYFKGNKHVA